VNDYPAEIEGVLLAHPRITDVALIVSTDLGLDERTVLEHCRGKLAGYELLGGPCFTDAIHRNPTGKARKRVLREQFPLDGPRVAKEPPVKH
jgi:acyl-CoA synthetase (AMP-forming)/AMP-acid ligase II